MDTQIMQMLPESWRAAAQFLSIPVHWLIPAQGPLLKAAWACDIPGLAMIKRLFLVLPALAMLTGLWCSMLSIYTLPFRSGRVRFVGTELILWWDLVRTIWLFWAGMARLLWLLIGSVWGLLQLLAAAIVEILREVSEMPFLLMGTIASNLRTPGVPWIAFLLTVAWAALEATIFTYVLSPTIGEILSDLTGRESHRFLGVMLFAMLYAMIAGSLACMYVLVEAAANKDYKQMVQMLIVEFFVMFVEVMFLYREMIDALTPWIASQTGLQLGFGTVLALASFSWLGIRGMTWFLFGRYGTPTLLALISRQRLPEEAKAAATASASQAEHRWDRVFSKIKGEQNWFHERGQALLEAAVLPSFQVIAAGLNFCVVLLVSQPIFSLPFKNLAEVQETKNLVQSIASLAEVR
ncbi:MAG: hypothetical protein HY549_08330 [Elusimicrobia bacterium]|nr:hypothetical protein [Elusimicrobiota bacterium]